MKQIIEAATDAAMVCFFDPAALPADFDDKSCDKPYDIMEELAKEGRFWFKETGGDGGYLFHFYVDEQVPDDVLKHSQDREEIGRFHAPGGVIWACGTEYAARDPIAGHRETPRGGLGKFSHMGGRFEIPKGNYALTAWRAEWPDQSVKDATNGPDGNHVPSLKSLGMMTGIFFVISVIGTLLWIPRAFNAFTSRAMSSAVAWSWGLLILSWGLCIFFMRKLTRAQKNPALKAVEQQFPDFVIQMRRLG